LKLLGNILWLIFGGIETAIEYFLAGFALLVTIIGIPFGLQAIKIGVLELWPFGSTIVEKGNGHGCLNLFMNVLWFFIGGVWIWLTHILFGVLLYISIIGIPFGKQHFKMAKIALSPFGKEIYS